MTKDHQGRKRVLLAVIVIAFLGAAVLAFTLGNKTLDAVVGIVLVLWVGIIGYALYEGRLRRAQRGSVRVRTVKARAVRNTVAIFTRSGWQLTDQSSSKSFGSQTRVTMTFRKMTAPR